MEIFFLTYRAKPSADPRKKKVSSRRLCLLRRSFKEPLPEQEACEASLTNCKHKIFNGVNVINVWKKMSYVTAWWSCELSCVLQKTIVAV